ncbi:MAG: hemerythrin family protein [Rhodospirillales bacterium]|nr:hemerythrin family protein [Rhodospirillales bacterium]
MNDSRKIPQIEWRAEFETGDAAIDHEHKDMIERINHFLIAADTDPTADDLLAHLGEIHAWISAHFALEEKIMRDQKYDAYEPHKDDHETLLDDLRDIMEEIETEGYAGAGQKLQQRLSDWFINHFKTQDARWHSSQAKNP